jgi:hypothetical protein
MAIKLATFISIEIVAAGVDLFRLISRCRFVAKAASQSMLASQLLIFGGMNNKSAGRAAAAKLNQPFLMATRVAVCFN